MRALSAHQIGRIVDLLRNTDMLQSDIARRMGVSRSAVQLVNKKYKIREYAGHNRATWKVVA